MWEFLRVIAGSCRLYAVEQPSHSLISLAAGLAFACLLGFGLFAWTRAFNKSYGISRSQLGLVVITCLLCAASAPLWFALNLAGKFGDAEVRALLVSLSEDPVAMSEIRQQTYDALSAGSAGKTIPREEPPIPSGGERWSFTIAPDDESMLALADAYIKTLSAAMTERSALLSKFLSWSSASGFLAADIRLNSEKHPAQPYDLDPGRDALASILTSEFARQTQAAVFVLRVLASAILVALISIMLAWLGFAAYRDIHVHWPGEI